MEIIHHLPGMAYRCLNQRERPLAFVSEGCKVLSGYSRSELETTQPLWDKLIHADNRETIWQQIQQAVSNQNNYSVEYRVITKTAESRWVNDFGVQSPTDKTCLEGFIVDITKRKKVELALSEKHTYAETVVETAVEAIISIDTKGTIETFNTAAQQMFGYSLKEIRGKNVRVLMPEPYHSEHDGYLSHYVTTNEARIIGKSRDISRQRDAELEARQHREQLAHMD
jgi:two-component system sensor kinase FixL